MPRPVLRGKQGTAASPSGGHACGQQVARRLGFGTAGSTTGVARRTRSPRPGGRPDLVNCPSRQNGTVRSQSSQASARRHWDLLVPHTAPLDFTPGASRVSGRSRVAHLFHNSKTHTGRAASICHPERIANEGRSPSVSHPHRCRRDLIVLSLSISRASRSVPRLVFAERTTGPKGAATCAGRGD